jgi:hypothetical protein
VIAVLPVASTPTTPVSREKREKISYKKEIARRSEKGDHQRLLAARTLADRSAAGSSNTSEIHGRLTLFNLIAQDSAVELFLAHDL